jgi:hypothetical protein
MVQSWWAAGLLAAVAGATSCAPGAVQGDVRVGHLTVAEVGARVVPVAAGVEVCITEVRGRPASGRWCVGPHDGENGANRSWSRAERLSDDSVVYLAVVGPDDRLDDARFASAPAAGPATRAPVHVTVVAGVLDDYPGTIVCSTYLSGGTRVRYETGVSGELGSRDVELPVEGPPCATA